MCVYSYAFFSCGCDFFVYEAELCGNYCVPAQGSALEVVEMCPNGKVTCYGQAGEICDECNDDWDLEFELDEW